MKSKKPFNERGQALIVIALSAIVLFGFAALAIDGTKSFSDRRHAQNAADTAALAGALALVNGETDDVLDEDDGTVLGIEWKLNALDRAKDNGYNNNLSSNQVWVFKCSDAVNARGNAPLDCGPYEGNGNYLSVIILSHVNTTFARVLGVEQTHNLVQAVTFWNKRGPAYDGNLIVALKPNCLGSNDGIFFAGNATITLDGGGAFINSGSCEITQGGSNCPVFTGGAGLGSASSGNIDMGICSIPTPVYNQDAYQFPPEMPDVPAECGMSGYPSPLNNSSTNTSYLYPGRYSSFPPKLTGPNKLKDNVILMPGTYCVNGDITWGSNSNSSDFTTLTGANVTIYVTSGNRLNITGSNINITAPATGDYAGYLFIVNSNFSGQAPQCLITGNSGNMFTGTIFAPYCDVEVRGNSTTASFDTQIIGYTVTINGGANTQLTYDASDNAQSEPKVGLMR